MWLLIIRLLVNNVVLDFNCIGDWVIYFPFVMNWINKESKEQYISPIWQTERGWFMSDLVANKLCISTWYQSRIEIIEPFWSRWKPLCTVAGVCGCSGWDDRNSTWDGSGLCSCSEGEDSRLRLALLILCHHANLILCIPLQAVQHHILTAMRKADLWFPVGYMLLRKQCRK